MEAHLDACEQCRRAVAAAASDFTLPATVVSTELTPGMRVARYEIQRELGRGGMGVVYLARDITLDRLIALKLLHARHDEAAQARLLREAQVMARLSHPNVVPVFELGDWRGELYLTMELVSGRTLAAWLKAAPRTSAEILSTFIEAGRGLAAAHAAGIVHRDFKPENVLVGHDGRVRVTDFGLSRPGSAVVLPPFASPLITREGALAGTLAYMAPEQLDGKPADERSDQFSFCVALAEALLGARPFEGENWSTLARAHAELPRLKGNLPSRVRKVLQRGLSADPSRRYSSMVGLLDTLLAKPRHAPWLALAGVAPMLVALAIGQFLPRARQVPFTEEGMSMTPVVVAATDLDENTVLTWDMISQRAFPKLYVTKSVVRPNSAGYILGQKLSVSVLKGDPLLWSHFVATNASAPVLSEERVFDSAPLSGDGD
jgi:predicted Ser/Thr protein kinase